MDANFENNNVNSPVIKIVGYGKNCRLEPGENGSNPVQIATSLNDLKTKTNTSYYTNGEDFYVRVIPKNWWDPITPNSQVISTAYTTMPTRHGITCDPGFLPKRVVGKILDVKRGATETTISGWACNYTHPVAIKVNLYAQGKIVRSLASPVEQKDVYTFIKQITSSQVNQHESIAFNCGRISSAGRYFKFTLSNSEADMFKHHKVVVKGISNSNGSDIYLENSGVFTFKPKVIQEKK
jgi:hypothetical protein